MSVPPGSRLGPYVVDVQVGAGGMGEVYRAHDSRLGRDVALKVISPRLVGDPSTRRRFELEARAASALNHPAIVTIYDVGETDGVSWMAMEWVDGRTLRDAIAQGPLTVSESLSIARQIAGGLAAAHGRGIVHRDLKPDNVMIARDGRAKILDFGLARQTIVDALGGSAAATVSAAPSVQGSILGTVGYMSPEQAAAQPADFRSDQFAFGAVYYEMLTGERAFGRSTAVETLTAIIRDEPRPLAAVRDDVPPPLASILARCLAKLPEHRFASTSELSAALDACATLSASSEVRPSTGTVDASPAWRRWDLRKSVVVAAAAIIAVSSAYAAWTRFTRPSGVLRLAVLPFHNATGDPEIEYLSDGLTDSLIEQVSRLPPLQVMAHGTVFRFKDSTDVRTAGRQLGVNAVVTGTVSRRADHLSIAAELVDVATGARLWGEKYERSSADLLRIQDTIAAEIADGLRLHLTAQERQAFARHGTRNVAAYDLLLKGRYFLTRNTEEDDLEARRAFLQAIEKDPSFADAHASVGVTYVRSAGNGYAPPLEAWARASEAAHKALELEPGNFTARVTLATERFYKDWDWKGAERDYAALRNDPRLFLNVSYHPVSTFYWATGHPNESVAVMEQALVVDSGNLESRIMLADFLAQDGRLEESLAHYKAIVATDPDEPEAYLGIADVLHRRGDIAGAADARRKALDLTGDQAGARALADVVTERDYDAAEVAFAKESLARLESLAKERYVSPLDWARLYAQIGDREKALAYLQQALTERSPGVVYLRVDRAWDRMRDDPRFTALVRTIGIP